METNENKIEKSGRKKRNFKDALKDVSKFINICRWIFMTIAVIEMLFACAYWVILFLTVSQVVSLGSVIIVMVYIAHYLIPIATLAQIVLLIVLGIDAAETKTEIKMRIIFVFMSIAPVLMMWSVMFDYWYKVISAAFA